MSTVTARRRRPTRGSGLDARRPAARRIELCRWRARAGSGMRRRRADRRTGAPQPSTRFVAIDVNAASLARAKIAAQRAGLTNVEFLEADVFALPFAERIVRRGVRLLRARAPRQPARRARRCRQNFEAGRQRSWRSRAITARPYSIPRVLSPDAPIQAQVDLQASAGGDANIGRRLYPLLKEAGFVDVSVEPRLVYVDGSRPDLADGFTLKTYTAMIAGVRERALAAGLMTSNDFDCGVADSRVAPSPTAFSSTPSFAPRRRSRSCALSRSRDCVGRRLTARARIGCAVDGFAAVADVSAGRRWSGGEYP